MFKLEFIILNIIVKIVCIIHGYSSVNHSYLGRHAREAFLAELRSRLPPNDTRVS